MLLRHSLSEFQVRSISVMKRLPYDYWGGGIHPPHSASLPLHGDLNVFTMYNYIHVVIMSVIKLFVCGFMLTLAVWKGDCVTTGTHLLISSKGD